MKIKKTKSKEIEGQEEGAPKKVPDITSEFSVLDSFLSHTLKLACLDYQNGYLIQNRQYIIDFMLRRNEKFSGNILLVIHSMEQLAIVDKISEAIIDLIFYGFTITTNNYLYGDLYQQFMAYEPRNPCY